MINKVAVLGAGNGGCAFSGHLAMKGFEVRLYEHPKFEKNIEEIRERNGIELKGKLKGFVKLSTVTTNMEEAIQGADIIIVAVPAFAQSIMMEMALSYLEDEQIVVFNPDNYGSLRFVKMMREKNIKKNIKIAGTASLLYACRRVGPSQINIWAVKDTMPVGVLPSTNIEPTIKSLKEIFPQFTPIKNILGVDFGNLNMIVHCPTVVLNTGRIESTKGNFMFYWEGMTESICRVMEEMDKERIKVGEKLGLEMASTLETMRQFYGSEKKGKDLHDFLTNSRVHGGRGRGPDAPKNLNHRYLSEDVPYGLVPVSSFGKLLNIPTPTIDSIILLSSIMNGEDYMKGGVTIEKMGLSDKTYKEIMKYIEEGK